MRNVFLEKYAGLFVELLISIQIALGTPIKHFRELGAQPSHTSMRQHII